MVVAVAIVVVMEVVLVVLVDFNHKEELHIIFQFVERPITSGAGKQVLSDIVYRSVPVLIRVGRWWDAPCPGVLCV